jgi:hypothetical protein
MYLAITYQDVLYSVELNPVGRWLIQADNGGVALFMSLKLCGTALVISLLIYLVRLNSALGIATAIGLTMAQLGLLAFLELG